MSNVIPDGWNFDFLPAFVEINPSFDKTLKLTDNTDVSFIKMEDVSNGGAVKNLRRRKYSEVKKGFTKFINNDVLVAKITPCFENGKGGHVKGLTNGIGFGSTEFHVFRAKENSDSSYFFHFSNYPTFRLKAEASMCGTGGQRRVQTDFFRTFKTTYPPLPEQQKIAAILSSVDEVIEKTQAQIEKLKDLKTGMMQELLSPREPKAGDQTGAKASKTNGLHHTEFKDSPLGRIPVGWDVVKFDDVLDKIDSGWSPSCIEVPPSSGEWGVLKVSAVTRGKFLESQSKTLPENLEPKTNIRVRAGDILLTRANGVADLVGKCVMINQEPKSKLMMSDKILRLKPNNLIFDEFLLHTFNSQVTRRQIELSWGGSSGQKNIGQADIKNYRLALPPYNEQKIIAKSISQIDNLLNEKSRKRDSLSGLKKALMQDLLTGKLRVSVN